MKQQKKLLPVKGTRMLLLSFLLVLLSSAVNAMTTEVVGNMKKTTVDGIEWTYTVLNEEEKTCEVGGVALDGKEGEIGIAAISESTTGNVTIPSMLDGYAVVGICNSAFREIPISEVVIPAGVKSIGEKAFMQCGNLISVTLPEGLTFIGEEAFSESAITNIALPESLVRIGEQAFEHTQLNTITLPKNVKFLGNEDRVSEMGDVIEEDDLYGDVFNGCASLTALNVAEGNTAYASVDGMLLTKDKKTLLFSPIACKVSAVPDGVEYIYESAFYKNQLTSITLPSSLNEIGRDAFYRCDNLNEVISWIEEPFEIAEGTFGYEPSATLYVPTGCKEKYEATKGWNLFKNIVEKGASSGIAIDETNFPDENFRNWVLAQDYGQDGVLTEAENAGVTYINVSGRNIASLKGIEYFTALTDLYCTNNQLTSLDMSENTVLKYLICDYNSLTSLNVTKNTALVNLDCERNQLTALDITNNTALTDLACGENLLTSLDVSKNINLEDFDCSNNQLTSLNVSNNKALSDFVCYKNKINGTAMDALIESLPTVNSDFVPISPFDSDEQNVITKSQVAAAQQKGWKVYALDSNASQWVEYDGDASGDATDTSPNTWTDSNGLTWSFTVSGTEATDIKPAMFDKTYIYGDPNNPSQGPVTLEPGDAAAGRFSSSEGKFFPTISDEVYSGLKTLIFEITEVTEGSSVWGGDVSYVGTTMRVMDGWWTNYADNVPMSVGLWELPITEAMAYNCAQSGLGFDLILLMTRGSVTIKSVYYQTISVPDVVEIPAKVYSGSTELTVTSIGDRAFDDCSNLTSVTIPESVTSIGDKAFWKCSNLTSVNIPEGVTTIGEYNQEIKGETNVEIIPVSA